MSVYVDTLFSTTSSSNKSMADGVVNSKLLHCKALLQAETVDNEMYFKAR